VPRSVPIERWAPAGPSSCNDFLAEESPLTIQVAHWFKDRRRTTRWGVTLRTPGHDEELALGLLYAEGRIENAADVERVESANPDEITVALHAHVDFDAGRERLATAACGFCGAPGLPSVQPLPDNGFRIGIQTLHALPARLRAAQEGFADTGALHAAALFNAEGELEIVREDIGRHSAVDKIIGSCLKRDHVELSRSGLLLSGRAGFELLQKAARAGIPFVAAIGAPSTLSVEAARAANITLAGFLRSETANVYTGTWRICKV